MAIMHNTDWRVQAHNKIKVLVTLQQGMAIMHNAVEYRHTIKLKF
jgi:hypothetical protein